MLDKWTGEVVGTMHIYEIKPCELAAEMGINRNYLSMLLHNKKKSKCAEFKARQALLRMIERRQHDGTA